MGGATSHGSCLLADSGSSEVTIWTVSTPTSSDSIDSNSIVGSPEGKPIKEDAERSSTASTVSSLGANRFGSSDRRLQVCTFEDEELSVPAHGQHRTIRRGVFKEEYCIGQEVMPSCHRGMLIMFATSKGSGAEVVVKIRFKKESFKKEHEEANWRDTTEFMLNLPPCPHIAAILDVIEDDNNYYVIMEKVCGKDLFESMRVTRHEALPVPEVKIILRQIFTAVAALHRQGWIHKDLKLENVMLDKAGSRSPGDSSDSDDGDSPGSACSVKLIDFDTVETPRQTADVLGTDQYIAPEAYDGNYSPASDMFALGVLAFQLLTGEVPFCADMFDDKPGENWVGSPRMNSIRTKLSKHRIEWNYACFKAEPRCCDLLRSLLAVDVNNRPSAEEALQHPWLAIECRRPKSTTQSLDFAAAQEKHVLVPMTRSISDGRLNSLDHPHFADKSFAAVENGQLQLELEPFFSL